MLEAWRYPVAVKSDLQDANQAVIDGDADDFDEADEFDEVAETPEPVPQVSSRRFCQTAVVRFRASEIASLVDGAVIGEDVSVDGATQDSRTLLAGQLFDSNWAREQTASAWGSAASPGGGAGVRRRSTGTSPTGRRSSPAACRRSRPTTRSGARTCGPG